MPQLVTGLFKRNSSSAASARSMALICLLLFASMAEPSRGSSVERASVTSESQQPKQAEVRELQPGQSAEREIAGGESHSYRISLRAGQYLNVLAQQEVDIEIRLMAPDGKTIASIDWQGPGATESLWALTDKSGDHKLDVALPNKLTKTGQYKVRIETIGEWQDASPRVKNLVTAHKLFSEASKLRDERKAESQQQAVETYDKSLPLWRAERDLLGEANTLNEMGFVLARRGDREKALGYYEQALALFKAENHRDVLMSLNNISLVYSYLGNPQKALLHFEEALTMARAQGDRRSEATILNNMRESYNRTGEFHKALDYGFQALALRRSLNDRAGEAVVLNNVGALYHRLGESQKALNYLYQSLALRRALKDQRGEGTTLTNIATVYLSFGESQKALGYLDQALVLRRTVGDRAGEAYTLNTIGICHYRLMQLSKALDYFNQSLTINREIADNQGIAFATNNIGFVYGLYGDHKKALDYHNQALVLSRSAQNRPAEALALGNIGAAYVALKEPQKSLEYLNQALVISQAIGDQTGRAGILRDIAQAKRDLGKLEEARSQIETALEIIETTRGKVTSPDLRSSYLASTQSYYKFHIDLLMQMYEQNQKSEHIAEALHSSERQRARSLLDLLSEAGMELRQGIDPELKQQERSIHARISDLQSQLIQSYSSAKPDKKRILALEKELKDAESKREGVQDSIKQKFSQYASIQYPTPLELRSIQQLLDDKTALLEYSLGRDASFLFVVSKSDFQAIRLPSAASISDQVMKLREAIAIEPDQTTLPKYFLNARSLYKDLIEPARKALAGKRSLIIVPDGILYYLPFETLLKPLPGKISQRDLRQMPYLIRDYSISYVPSASVLASLLNDSKKRPAPPNKFLAYADPVYTSSTKDENNPIRSAVDNTFGQSTPWKLQSLKYSREEVERIARLYPQNQTDLFLREQASEENVKENAKLSQYQYIHFAVHGLLNESRPQYSGLILSLQQSKVAKEDSALAQTEMGKEISSTQDPQIEDGLLQVYEIFNLKLNADLVVLSACETGLGKEVKGEGMIGLTRAFLYAGARSLVVSLWKVEDRSTAELMERLYRFAGNKASNKAEALRQAQLELIKSVAFSHPYRWAGFTLVGTP